MKGICDACGIFNPELTVLNNRNCAGLCVCDSDKICTLTLGKEWDIFRVTSLIEEECIHQFYAVKGAAVMVYDDGWFDSVMNRIELEQLEPLGLAVVTHLGKT